MTACLQRGTHNRRGQHSLVGDDRAAGLDFGEHCQGVSVDGRKAITERFASRLDPVARWVRECDLCNLGRVAQAVEVALHVRAALVGAEADCERGLSGRASRGAAAAEAAEAVTAPKVGGEDVEPRVHVGGHEKGESCPEAAPN